MPLRRSLICSLRALLLAPPALAAWVLASEPTKPVCVGLFSLTVIFPVFLVVGVIRGRNHVRAFCLGAILPACKGMQYIAEVVNAYRPATDSPFTKLLLIADLGFQRFIADAWIVSLVFGLCGVMASGLFFRDAAREGLGSSVPARRRGQFSLKGFFVMLTVTAIWLGVTVNQAREQRAAVRAIEALGGTVVYDWQLQYEYSEKYGFAFSIDGDDDPPGPAWLRRLVGDEFFQNVDVVFFEAPETNALQAIPHLQRLRTLRILCTPGRPSDYSPTARAELMASLPACQIW